MSSSELKLQSLSRAPARRPRYGSSIKHAQRPKVIFVEDDPDDQWLIEEAAKCVGLFEPLMVDDGAHLLKLLEQTLADRYAPTPANLIVLDLALPKVDGFTTLRRIKEQPIWSEVPVVVLTSADNPFYARFCVSGGAAGYLTKPPGFHQLCELMACFEQFFTKPPPPLSIV